MEMLVYWLDHVGPSLTAESLTVERPETTRDPLVTARSSPLRVHPGTAAEAPRLQHPKSGAARRTRDLRGVCEKGHSLQETMIEHSWNSWILFASRLLTSLIPWLSDCSYLKEGRFVCAEHGRPRMRNRPFRRARWSRMMHCFVFLCIFCYKENADAKFGPVTSGDHTLATTTRPFRDIYTIDRDR